jgi:hypothetical protein
MTIDRKFLAALSLATLLAGCETGFRDPEGDISTFGEANRQTMMAQVVDPDPQYEQPLATSADHAAKAVDRYRKDAVKKPDQIRSTQSGGSSGGGSN